MTWQVFMIPVACALSAWLATSLLIMFIFHPIHPVRVMGFKIQGVVPSRQAHIAREIGRIAATYLPSRETINERVGDPAQLEKIMPQIEAHIDDFLRNKLKQQMPVVGMLIGDRTIDSLRQIFVAELRLLFPTLISDYASNLLAALPVERLITEKLLGLSLPNIESNFRSRFSSGIRRARLAAILLGLVIGLLSMLIVVYIN
jgi:uncharacterized membrane protein YheB (UPF0754 family)